MALRAINERDERYNRSRSTRLITAPAESPISLQSAKDFLGITTTDQDDLVESVLLAATAHVEQQLQRALMCQTWEVAYPSFPCFGDPIALVIPPTLKVLFVTYYDLADVSQPWSAANYRVVLFSGPQSAPGVLKPKDGVSYPSTYDRADAVTVRFQAGYSEACMIPKQILHAVLMLMAHWYEHREAVAENGVQLATLGIGYESIIRANRWVG